MCSHAHLIGSGFVGFVRCNNRNCVQPYAHLEPLVLVTNVGVVHGHGVIARCDIAKGTVVCTYTGVSDSHLYQNNRSQYVLTVPWVNPETKQTEPFWIIDSVDKDNTAGRYINDPLGTGKSANVLFTTLPHTVHPVLTHRYYINVVACKDIKKGEELLVEYGVEYWRTGRIMVNNFVSY